MDKQPILNIGDDINENEIFNTDLQFLKIDFFGQEMWVIRRKEEKSKD